MVRGAFVRAIKGLEGKGRPLSTIITEQLQEHPVEMLRVISGFIPKEMMLELTVNQELDTLSDAALDHEIAQLARQAGSIPGISCEEESTVQ